MKWRRNGIFRALENEGTGEATGVLLPVSEDDARVSRMGEDSQFCGQVSRKTTVSKPQKAAQSLRGL